MNRRSVAVTSAIAFALLVRVAPAAAAGGTEAAAEALFGEAKKLAAQGKYAEACPKFAESNRLDRGAGTLIHLGDCYEKNKQSASAWAAYKEAASAAQALGRKDWEALATKRAAALEAKLAYLSIKVDPGNTRAEVTRDGTVVAPAVLGVPIPVDVGPHMVEATASGFEPFKTSVNVGKDGERIEVVVPKLEPEPTAVAASKPVAPAPRPSVSSSVTGEPGGSSQRTVGLVVGGVGVAGLAVGAITGLMAMAESSDAKRTCEADGRCASRDAVDASESAKTFGLVSTIAFVAGGVGLAAGAALVLTAPKESRDSSKSAAPRVRVSPNAGPTGAGLTVLGVF